MPRIACVGSTLPLLLLAVAMKRSAGACEVTVIEDGRQADDDIGFLLSHSHLGRTAEPIERLIGSPLILYPLKQSRIVRETDQTVINGSWGHGVDAARLRTQLRTLAGTSAFLQDSQSKPNLGDFDLVIFDDANKALATKRAMMWARTAPFRTGPLASDVVMQAVQRRGGVILGRGFAISSNESVFWVDMAGASDGVVCQEEIDTEQIHRLFAPVLAGARLGPINAVNGLPSPAQQIDGPCVRLGGSIAGIPESFAPRMALRLIEAIELASILADNGTGKDSITRFETGCARRGASAQRASALEIDWAANFPLYSKLPAATFAFSAFTRNYRVNHRDLERVAPSFIQTVNTEFAGTPPGKGAPPPMFVPLRLNGLTLVNRIGASPMCVYSAKDGLINDFHLVHLGGLAMGGAGLVFTEMTNVSPEARITLGCAGIYTAEQGERWRRVVDYVHQHTSAKIGMQLGHAGRRASTLLPWERANTPLSEGGWETLGPSAVPYSEAQPPPRAMARADMNKVIENFRRSTQWADAADFDLLGIHMGHGYLFSSFLSSLSNFRTDDYGGSFGNRARFPLEVIRAVRAVWPKQKPLAIRFNATDWQPGGTTMEQAIEFGFMLKEAGVDILDVSTGNVVNMRRPATGRLFQTPFSDRIRNKVGLPTMTVGRLSSYGDINSILAARRADICLIAKGHLQDPYFTRHAAMALGYPEQEWPSPYLPAQEYRFRRES